MMNSENLMPMNTVSALEKLAGNRCTLVFPNHIPEPRIVASIWGSPMSTCWKVVKLINTACLFYNFYK